MSNKSNLQTRIKPAVQELPWRMNSEQAAAYLGVSMRSLKDIRLARKLAYYRLGHRSISFNRMELDSFLANRRVEAL